MIHGSANKISRILRASMPTGANQSAVVACALAYAAPLPMDSAGNVTEVPLRFYNANIYPTVIDVVSAINEVQILETGMILDKTKETFVERANALSEPIIAPMGVTQNFTDAELKAVKAIVELLRKEFSGA